ncbi:ketopantoate reductase family protein [Marinobacter salarius]|uniref:2-dehydropantoate 2-reductase n=1 Tax=Marinobacter salarius TaxID=1420917 RepID=A0A1W6KB24_9GAMM|nr:2-dehydropantoate 2-reductase [Marinobacter salarius]ARM84645.1 2-dehydropantoate 2-reductase [Marinobacter salarius]
MATPGKNQGLSGNGRIAILGAGSMGQLWAGYLPTGTVTFIPRHEVSPETDQPALTYTFQPFEGPEEVVTVPYLLATAARPSLLMVTTKAGDTLDAIESNLHYVSPDTPIVLFQNGMGCQQAVAERWPQRPILAASTTEGANRPAPGCTVHAGKGETWVGPLTKSATTHLTQVVTALGTSGLTVHAEQDIQRRLWDKLIINAGINAFTAILDCPNGDILTDPFYREHIDELCDEISKVMKEDIGKALPSITIRERIETVARNTARNTSSMRSDRRRGRPTEIDFINGYIVGRGHALGVDVPTNQMLTNRIKQLSP